MKTDNHESKRYNIHTTQYIHMLGHLKKYANVLDKATFK